MLRSIIAVLLLACMIAYRDPTYAVAAGLFEIAGVIYGVTRPRRLIASIKEETTDG